MSSEETTPIKFYKLKETSSISIWEHFMSNNGELPLDEVDEISEEEFLSDKSGKTVTYGGTTEQIKSVFGRKK